eukprot:6243223-Prymnesium_polylepis.1
MLSRPHPPLRRPSRWLTFGSSNAGKARRLQPEPPARARALGDALLYVDPSQHRDSPSTIKVTETRGGDVSRPRASFLLSTSTVRLLGSAARRHG